MSKSFDNEERLYGMYAYCRAAACLLSIHEKIVRGEGDKLSATRWQESYAMYRGTIEKTKPEGWEDQLKALDDLEAWTRGAELLLLPKVVL